MRKPIVYIATNKVTGDQYIGLTMVGLTKRRTAHFGLALRNESHTHFHRAIRKYGKEAFEFYVLQEFETYEAAKQGEIEAIERRRPHYNMTIGGDGCSGYKHSPRVVAEIRKRTTGRPGFWKGKTLPPHVVEITRARGKTRPDKLRVLALGPKSQQRRVVCLDDGREFESINSAARHYRINGTSIAKVCARDEKRRTVGGLVFRFFGDHGGGSAEADAMRAAAKKAGRKLAKPNYQRPVICMTDGRVFSGVIAAARGLGVNTGMVVSSCKLRHKIDRGNRPVFRYLADYQASID